MIKIENLNYKYKSGENVLENINMEIQEGKIISIIGKNGSGKSTLLSLIAGLYNPTKGHIIIDDIDTSSKKDTMDLRKKVGIVFQNPDNQILFPSVYDDMEFALNNLKIDNKKERIEQALETVNMKEFMYKDSYELSLGQKQRINIASVLSVAPKYLLMDEPTTMVDSYEKEKIYNCFKKLKSEGYTIVFVTNNINEILLSDKIVIIENKQIKKTFEKNDILDNIQLLKESEIRIPDVLQIIMQLKEKNINIEITDWTMDGLINNIVNQFINSDI